MPNTPRKSLLPIDDQLIAIVKLGRVAGFDDGAQWIQRHVMETADLAIAPDASRTDAVREVINMVRASADHYTISMKSARLLVVALADAEREHDLAIAHDRQPYPTTWAYEQVCEALEVAKAKLTDSEKRAKEVDIAALAVVARAERHVELIRTQWRRGAAELKARIEEERERANGLELARDLLRESNAALTHKLATARAFIERWANDKHNGGACRKCNAAEALAAIDASAGEGKRPCRCGFTNDGNGCEECRPPRPSEPANAQGSEACNAYLNSESLNRCGNTKPCTSHPWTTPQSSSQPFTVEEARERANTHDKDVEQLRRLAPRSNSREHLETCVIEHERAAESWRYYAAMKECADALERAAEELLISYDQSASIDAERFAIGSAPLDYYVEQLRSVLAQRAGKGE